VQFANRRAIVGRSYKTAMLKVLYLAPKTCLTGADEGAELLTLNPTQTQFSLNCAASRKQIPFSFYEYAQH